MAFDKTDVDKISKLPEYSELDFGGLTGRQLMSLTDCKCSIRNIVRAHRSTPGRGGASFSLGRPREIPVKLPGTLWTECYSMKGKGIAQCNISDKKSASTLQQRPCSKGNDCLISY